MWNGAVMPGKSVGSSSGKIGIASGSATGAVAGGIADAVAGGAAVCAPARRGAATVNRTIALMQQVRVKKAAMTEDVTGPHDVVKGGTNSRLVLLLLLAR